VLKGRINWSFNFSVFIVREEITEVLPWGEQQLKVRPGSFYPRRKKVRNLLNSGFEVDGVLLDNYCTVRLKTTVYDRY